MVPVWGTAAVLIAPPAPMLSTGYVPGNTLPAQYWNYIFFHITKELNNVLTAAGVAQSGATDTQLTSSINLLAGNTLISTSGTLGTIALTYMNTMYVLTAASTATLPATAPLGARVTFKCLGAYGVTIAANTGQTIGDGGAATTNAIGITGTGAFVTLQWDVTNSIWHIVASNTSIINSASGALGTATQATDSFYEFTATGSLTLPKYPENGCVYTIKNKSSATVTINANVSGVSQTIGTTTSTAFLLYAQEDYVVLRYSLADTTWYVVATNGPVLSSPQTSSPSTAARSWTGGMATRR